MQSENDMAIGRGEKFAAPCLKPAFAGARLTLRAMAVSAAVIAKRVGIKDFAPHDVRHTCARLCHMAGGELEQIQFLLGHASVQTTERYLGCKQKLSQAVNDNLGLALEATCAACGA